MIFFKLDHPLIESLERYELVVELRKVEVFRSLANWIDVRNVSAHLTMLDETNLETHVESVDPQD
jgi:DNA recombination-dependent growth factor C